MSEQFSDNLSAVVADGLEFGWMRERTHDELSDFIEARHAALPADFDFDY